MIDRTRIITREVMIRQAICSWARWGAAHEPQIHYAQVRPIPVWVKHGALPLTTDCSGWATLCYKWAGAPDPTGNGFIGAGFTGSMLNYCEHIPQAQAKAGDLLVFGKYPGHHVVILLEPGTVADPLVCSHGQERGPGIWRVSEEAKYQPSYKTFLRVHFPVPPAPPAPNPISDNLSSNQLANRPKGGGGGTHALEA